MENNELQEQRESLGTEYYKIGQIELEQKNDKEAIRNFVYALCLNWNLYDVYLKLAKLSEDNKLYTLALSCYGLYLRDTNTKDLELKNHYEELRNKLNDKLKNGVSELYKIQNQDYIIPNIDSLGIDLLDNSNKVKKVYREVLEFGINYYYYCVAAGIYGLNNTYTPSVLAQLLDIKHHIVKCGNSTGLKSRYSLKDMINSNGVFDIFSEEEYQLIKYLYFTALIYNEIPEESRE